MPNDAGSSPKRSKVLHLYKGFTWSETCGKANMQVACNMEVSNVYPEQTLMLGLETTLLKWGKILKHCTCIQLQTLKCAFCPIYIAHLILQR